MFSNKDNKDLYNYAKENGYKPSSTGNGYINSNGNTIKPSESGGSWTADNIKYSSLPELKKSGRV